MRKRVETVRAAEDEVMTLGEIARYLKVSEKTIHRMLHSGELPGAKVLGQWRFVRSVMDDWLNGRMYAAPKKQLLNIIGTERQVVPLATLVSKKRMILDLKPGSKPDILAQLAVPLVTTGIIPHAGPYVEELVAREEVVSTAIGHGVACPHVRNPGTPPVASPCIVLAVCHEGTDFGALDGKKTHLFTMPCSNSETVHLRVMAKIALAFRNSSVMKPVLAATTTAEIMRILVATDEEIERRV